MSIANEIQQTKRKMLGSAGIHTWVYNIKERSIRKMDGQGNETEILYENLPDSLLEKNRVYPLDKKRIIDFFQSINEGKESGSVEIRWHMNEADEYEWYRYSFETIFVDGEPKRAVLVKQNIQTEKKLWEQNHHLFGSLSDEKDALEGVLLRHVAMNSFYKLIYVDGVSGKGVEYLVHPKEKYHYFEPIESIDINSEKYLRKYCRAEILEDVIAKSRLDYILEQLEKNDKYAFYFESAGLGGDKRYLKGECSFINREMRQISYVFTDVTEAVAQNENQKEALELALSAADCARKTREDFLANISHQIRTPLNAIVGMAELTRMDDFDTSKLQENMDVVLSSSQTLVNMVDDLLDTSQASSGNITIHAKPCDLMEIMEDIKDNFLSLYLRKGQNFEETLHIKHSKVCCDGSRLLRVLLNLLGNSAKFTPVGGTIALRVWEEEPKNGKVKYHFIVEDTGKGIEKDDLQHVFEPFFRDRESQNLYLEGNGLGLVVVKEILDAKGATITIDSEPGIGTRVEIVDEIEIIENTEAVAERTLGQLLAGKKVLVVEDQPINLMVAKRMLERYGAEADTAENGKIAVEKYLEAPENTYEMIFMDIHMPILNGYDASVQIRGCGRADAKTVKIVSMTADVFPEDIKKALDAGMDAHIGKPIRSEDLGTLIENLLKK